LADDQPSLSVVVASYNARDSIDACLESLVRQTTSKAFETIVIDSSTDGTAERVRRKYPQFGLLTSPRRLYCGDARNRGLALARAPIVAFLDADCFVEADWVEAVLRAHESQHWLVGGVIDNGNPASALSWAYYFLEFSLWLPRSERQEVAEMAGCCLSLKREAFDKYGPFRVGTYSSDTAFQWRMRRDGHKVLLDPAIRVYHTLDSTPRQAFSHTVEHRRCFVRVARSEKMIGFRQRWALVGLAPVYPLLLLALTATRVLRRRAYAARFLRVLPLVFIGCCARAWGELTGLLERAPKAG
jgi:GT2 family glycosyltransferase